jgi:hypothetical protein
VALGQSWQRSILGECQVEVLGLASKNHSPGKASSIFLALVCCQHAMQMAVVDSFPSTLDITSLLPHLLFLQNDNLLRPCQHHTLRGSSTETHIERSVDNHYKSTTERSDYQIRSPSICLPSQQQEVTPSFSGEAVCCERQPASQTAEKAATPSISTISTFRSCRNITTKNRRILGLFRS